MLNKNNPKHCLPAPFQKGTKENELATKVFEAGSIAAGIMFGLAQVFKCLCQADQAYGNQKRK